MKRGFRDSRGDHRISPKTFLGKIWKLWPESWPLTLLIIWSYCLMLLTTYESVFKEYLSGPKISSDSSKDVLFGTCSSTVFVLWWVQKSGELSKSRKIFEKTEDFFLRPYNLIIYYTWILYRIPRLGGLKYLFGFLVFWPLFLANSHYIYVGAKPCPELMFEFGNHLQGQSHD